MNIKLFKDTFKTLFLEDVAYNNVKDAFKNNLWQLISSHCGIIDLSTKKKPNQTQTKKTSPACAKHLKVATAQCSICFECTR